MEIDSNSNEKSTDNLIQKNHVIDTDFAAKVNA